MNFIPLPVRSCRNDAAQLGDVGPLVAGRPVELAVDDLLTSFGSRWKARRLPRIQ